MVNNGAALGQLLEAYSEPLETVSELLLCGWDSPARAHRKEALSARDF